MEKIILDEVKKNYTEELIHRLLADEEIQQMAFEYGFDNNTIARNMVIFDNWKKKRECCKYCTGLSNCQSDPEGYEYDIDENLYDVLKPCRYLREQKKQMAHKNNYLLCDLADKNLLCSLATIDITREQKYYREIVSILQQWENELPAKGFYFHGGLGVGKTYLAACICNDLAKQGKKVAFVNFPRLCTEIRNNVAEKDFVDSKLRKMRNAYLLVLDDIGAENMSNYIRDDILFTILDYRMENGKRTMFTSNCNLDTLRSRMMMSRNGEEDQTKAARIIERIKTLCDVIPVTGQSRRG